MPKLNREDIIKALRCFSSPPNSCNCIDCYFETDGLCEQNCSTELADVALTLIKQLTEENERLKTDAVPRSEVEELKQLYEQAKQEVAREIFEEIEKIISKNTQHDIKYGQLMVSGYNGRQIARFIADLKKKHIG